MGAWGEKAFDNDDACDWVEDLLETDGLSMVESAIRLVVTTGDDYLEADLASDALAACEVIARLRHRPGYTDAYTEPVDQWVAANAAVPSRALVTDAQRAIDRITGADSELRELWEDSDDTPWRAAVADLRTRLGG